MEDKRDKPVGIVVNLDPSKVMEDKRDKPVDIAVNLDPTKVMEDTRKQLEAARDQVKKLESLLEVIQQQIPSTAK